MSLEQFETAVFQKLFPPLPRFEIRRGRAALLILDVQRDNAHPGGALGRRAREAGAYHLVEGYFERVRAVVGNLLQVLAAARESGLEVIHVATAFSRAPGSVEAAILEEVRPTGDEIVLAKTTSSAFYSTPLRLILHNMGVDTLIIAGLATDGCVHSTTCDARDLGFRAIVVTDACATFVPEVHDKTLRFLMGTHGNGRPSAEVVEEIRTAAR